VRVFLDTNVLASAFGTRGLCADVLRLVLAEHEFVTGEPVIGELRWVLRRKFGVPIATVREIEALLREYRVAPAPKQCPICLCVMLMICSCSVRPSTPVPMAL